MVGGAAPAKKRLRIGVTGVSTSGKSTLVESLRASCNFGVVSGDDFYIRDGKAPTIEVCGRQMPNWDDPNSINWAKFYEALINSKDDVVLVDSFQLFYSKDVASTLDAVIIIEFAPDEFPIALDRKVFRFTHFHPPQNYRETPFASSAHYESVYFEDVVWKKAYEFKQYWDLPGFGKPVLRLRATAPMAKNADLALKFVSELIESK